jgi:hypothetical protein
MYRARAPAIVKEKTKKCMEKRVILAPPWEIPHERHLVKSLTASQREADIIDVSTSPSEVPGQHHPVTH